MGGNQIYFSQQPDRKAMFAQLLADMLEQHRTQKAAQEKAQQDAQLEVLKADPALRESLARIRGVQYDPALYPNTPEQNLAAAKARMGLGGIEDPKLLGPGGAEALRFNIVSGGHNPNESIASAAVARGAMSGDYGPDMVTRQKIEDKVIPTGQETWENTNVKRPTAIAENAKTNAETAFTRGPKTRAEDALANERNASANLTGAVGQDIVAGVITDPQSYFGLPTDQKKAFLKTVGRAPSKLSAAEHDRLNAAKMGRQLVDDAAAIVEKWEKRGSPIVGPGIGRYNNATGQWGEPILPSTLQPAARDEYYGDVAQLREWLTSLPVMEAKALAGGRTAYQVIQAITSVSPSMTKGLAMYRGSTNGLRTRFDQIADTIDKKQWGGHPPSQAGVAPDKPAAAGFLAKHGYE